MITRALNTAKGSGAGRMGLFSRSRAKPERLPIPAFWDWWHERGGALLAASIADGTSSAHVEEVIRHVAAIHPDLAWELSAGTGAMHTFCLTGSGNPALRPLAERWRRSAPAPDATWEFTAARGRSADVLDAVLEMDGIEFRIDQCKMDVEFDGDRRRVDISMNHPRFSDASELVRGHVTFLALDWLLGEDDVERWVGGVNIVTGELQQPRSLIELRDLVDGLGREVDNSTWVLLNGKTAAGDTFMVAALRPLKWIDHPLMDLHSAVHVPYVTDRRDGLPDGNQLTRLREIEDGLSDVLQDRGLLVAHETAARNRTLHLYTDSQDQNVTDLVTRHVRSVANATIESHYDPGWRAVRQFA